ncbi:MAG: hypothetical protein ABII72_04040 [Parcubacteria group bacterium]
MGQKEVKTIGELHRFLQGEFQEQRKSIVGEIKREMATKKELAGLRKEMATKTELAGLKKDLSATKTQVDIIARNIAENMATKEDLSVIRKDMATKADIIGVNVRMDSFESNYVRQKDFAKFRDKTFIKLDEIKVIFDNLNTEDIAEKGGLQRVSNGIEKNSLKIKANRRDINQIKLHLKVA